MKKIFRVLIIALVLLMTAPAVVSAAPRGYKEIRITTSNFKKYFSFKKGKIRNSNGKVTGHSWDLYFNLRKRWYFIVRYEDFFIKVKLKYTYKSTYKGKTYQYTDETIQYLQYPGAMLFELNGGDKKIVKLETKVLSARGTILISEPNNFGGKKFYRNLTRGRVEYEMVMRYPCQATELSRRYVEGQGWVDDYYYIERIYDTRRTNNDYTLF